MRGLADEDCDDRAARDRQQSVEEPERDAEDDAAPRRSRGRANKMSRVHRERWYFLGENLVVERPEEPLGPEEVGVKTAEEHGRLQADDSEAPLLLGDREA